MKILITSFDYRPRLGGVSSCAYHLAKALGKLPGIEVRVLAPLRPGCEEFDRASGVATRRVRLPRGALKAIPVLALQIARELRAWKPDVILNTLWHPCSLATLLARFLVPRSIRRPYFVITHGMELIESERNLKKKLRKKLAFLKTSALSRAETVFAVSRYTAALAEAAANLRPGSARVCANGVDFDEFHPKETGPELRAELNPDGAFVFLTISRLVPNKGIDQALRAFARVVRSHPKAMYLIAGSGLDRNRLEALAWDLDLTGNVKFLGEVTQARMVELYNLADCFVLLSREDRSAPHVEGFGIVFLEAAACGKPSIAGKSGGIPDAVEDGRSGWLVDPHSVEAIAERMQACLRDPRAVAAAGEFALQRARDGFTWRHAAEKIRQEMERSLDAR